MIIDCGQCTMRDIACHDCVVSHFLGTTPIATPTPGLDLPLAEERALRVLQGAGLVPPLRLVTDTGRDAVAG